LAAANGCGAPPTMIVPQMQSYGAGLGGDSAEKEALVNQIKDLGRADVRVKDAWVEYCMQLGNGNKDPARHPPEFLQTFLSTYQSGGCAGVGGGGAGGCAGAGFGGAAAGYGAAGLGFGGYGGFGACGGCAAAGHFGLQMQPPQQQPVAAFSALLNDPYAAGGASAGLGGLAEDVKTLQKKSRNFKAAWEQFCMQYGGGRCDPHKHEHAFLHQFLESLADQAMGGGGGGGAIMGAPPAKRLRDASGVGFGSVGGVKDSLVNRIFAFTRLGPDQEGLWALYADTFLNGIRDPSRHDTEVLNEFCVNHNVPDVAPQPSGGALPMRPPAGFGFGLMGGAAAAAAAGGGNDAGPMDPEKQGLVDRVKEFSRQSRDNAQTWVQWCGRIKDPARHEAAKLMEFCNLYGI